jgi:hypothetical protein
LFVKGAGGEKMTFQTIKWHQTCLRNFKQHIDMQLSNIIKLQEKLIKDEEQYNFKEMQISEALRQGKEKFDNEKFLVKRSGGKK